MDQMPNLYAVPFTTQHVYVAQICWGLCGMGLAGALMFEGVECIPCRQDECLYLELQTPEAVGEVNDEPVYLRKLRRTAEKADNS